METAPRRVRQKVPGIEQKAGASRQTVVRHVPAAQQNLSRAIGTDLNETYNDEVQFLSQQMNIVIEETPNRDDLGTSSTAPDVGQTLKIRLSRQMTKEQQERLLSLESTIHSLKNDTAKYRAKEIEHRNDLHKLQAALIESSHNEKRLENDVSTAKKQHADLLVVYQSMEKDLLLKSQYLIEFEETCSNQKGLLKENMEIADRLKGKMEQYEFKSREMQENTATLEQEVAAWKEKEILARQLASKLYQKVELQSQTILECGKTNEDLSRKLRTLKDMNRKEKANSDTRIKLAIDEMANVKKTIAGLEGKAKNEFAKSREEQMKVVTARDEEIVILKATEAKLTREVTEYAGLVEKTESERDNLSAENYRLKLQLKEMETEQKQLIKLRKEVAKLESENKQVNTALISLRKNLKSSHERKERCSICSNDLETRLQKVLLENKQLKQDVRDQKGEIERISNSGRHLTSDLEKSLKERLEWSKAEIQRQSGDNSRTIVLVEKLQTERSQLQRQIEKLQAALRENSLGRKAVETENGMAVKKLRKELLTMQKELSEQIAVNEAFKVSTSETSSHTGRLKKRNEKLIASVTELQKNNQTLKSSLAEETRRLQLKLQKSNEASTTSRSKLADELQNCCATNRRLEDEKQELAEKLAHISVQFETYKKDSQHPIRRYEEHNENLLKQQSLKQELDKSRSDATSLEERMILELNEAKRESAELQRKLDELNKINIDLKTEQTRTTLALNHKISELKGNYSVLENNSKTLRRRIHVHWAEKAKVDELSEELTKNVEELDLQLLQSRKNESVISEELEKMRTSFANAQESFANEKDILLHKIETLNQEILSLKNINVIFETNAGLESKGQRRCEQTMDTQVTECTQEGAKEIMGLKARLEKSQENESKLLEELRETKANFSLLQERLDVEGQNQLTVVANLHEDFKLQKEKIVKANISFKTEAEEYRSTICKLKEELDFVKTAQSQQEKDFAVKENQWKESLEESKRIGIKLSEELETKLQQQQISLQDSYDCMEKTSNDKIVGLTEEVRTMKKSKEDVELHLGTEIAKHKSTICKLKEEMDRIKEAKRLQEKDYYVKQNEWEHKFKESKRIEIEMSKQTEKMRIQQEELVALQSSYDSEEKTGLAKVAALTEEVRSLKKSRESTEIHLNAEITKHKLTIQSLTEEITRSKKILFEQDENLVKEMEAKVAQCEKTEVCLKEQLVLVKERCSALSQPRSVADDKESESWKVVRSEWNTLFVSITTCVESMSWVSIELQNASIQRQNFKSLSETHQNTLAEFEEKKLEANQLLRNREDELEKDAEIYRQAIKSYKLQVEDMRNQRIANEERIKKLRERWDDDTVELKTLETENGKLRDEISTITEQLKESKTENIYLMEELSKLKQENEKLEQREKIRVDEERQKNVNSSDLHATSSQSSQSENEISDGEEARDEVKIVKKENEKLHGKLFRLTRRYKEKKTRIIELQVGNERAVTRQRHVENELEKLKLKLDSVSGVGKDKGDTEQKLVILQREFEEMERKLESSELKHKVDTENLLKQMQCQNALETNKATTEVESVTINLVEVTEEFTQISQSGVDADEKTKLLEENRRLRMEIDRLEKKLERSKSKRLPLLESLKESRAINLKLEEEIRQAYVEMSKLEKKMFAFQPHKRKEEAGDAKDCDACNQVERENSKLLEENARLKIELRKLDDRMAEMEDTEYNYQETVRQNVIYEQQLSRITSQYDVQRQIAPH